MRILAAFPALVLCGCAVFAPDWSVYRTSTADPAKPEDNSMQFEADRKFCEVVAENWRQRIAALGVMNAGVQGALSNSASLNPIAIVVGGIAGAANSALAQAGLSVSDVRSQFLDCMQRRTDADHSAHVPQQR